MLGFAAAETSSEQALWYALPMHRAPVMAIIATGFLLSACGGAPTEPQDATPETPTATTSISAAPSTTAAPTTYERWAKAYGPYAGPGDVNQKVFAFQQGLCTTLRNGGEPAHGTWPAQSPAQVLREGWGVGLPDANTGLATKGLVAETVIIPIMCPDQSAVIADAKAGNFTKQLRTSFGNGKYLVGVDIAPGTYTVNERVSNCYWERSDSQGNIIDNNFISVAPSVTVTIAESDSGFTSQDCGTWNQ